MSHWAGTTPRRWQAEAFDAVLGAMRAGTTRPLVHATTGSGKSRLLGALAAACKGPVLVTTPTQALVDQLAATIEEHCPGEVGRAYQHAWDTTPRVVVSCIPSLPAVLAERPEWACWLADEAHRLEGLRVRETREALVSRVAVGLTATPYTNDWRGLALWDEVVYSYGSYDAVQDGCLVPWRVVRSAVRRDVEELTAEWVAEADGPGIVSAVTVADADACAARLTAAGQPALSVHGYLPRHEQHRRLALLQRGAVRCLVHCQLLAEGVDLPWLRWLVLRRTTSSPVRLVQEVGRVLRAAPGKTEAVLYDPHDCLGAVGLVHGARLEDAQRSEKARLAAEPLEIPELPGLEGLSGLPRSQAVSVLEGWTTDTLALLRAAGKAPPPEAAGGFNPQGPWRKKKASDKQRAAAQRWLSALQYLPSDAHRAAVVLLLDQESLRAGTASDLVTVLITLAKKRTARDLPLPLPAPGQQEAA